MKRLTDKEQVYVIDAFTTQLIPMIEIAKTVGITRQGVHKLLRSAGVDTSKDAAHIPVTCTACGKETTKLRCQFRKNMHSFCDRDCYAAWLRVGNGNPLIMHRTGSRIARTVVAAAYPLKDTDIVHHEDRNQMNNELVNLKVFANTGDHVRYHRGFNVPVLFDGSKYKGRRRR